MTPEQLDSIRQRAEAANHAGLTGYSCDPLPLLAEVDRLNAELARVRPAPSEADGFARLCDELWRDFDGSSKDFLASLETAFNFARAGSNAALAEARRELSVLKNSESLDTVALAAVRAQLTQVANHLSEARRRECTALCTDVEHERDQLNIALAERDKELAEIKAAVVELAPAPAISTALEWEELHRKYLTLLETWEQQQPVAEAATAMVNADRDGNYYLHTAAWQTLQAAVDALPSAGEQIDKSSVNAADSSSDGAGQTGCPNCDGLDGTHTLRSCLAMADVERYRSFVAPGFDCPECLVDTGDSAHMVSCSIGRRLGCATRTDGAGQTDEAKGTTWNP